MALTKQVNGNLKMDDDTFVLNPLLTINRILINTDTKNVFFTVVATITGVSASRNTSGMDYSGITSNEIPSLANLNTLLNTWVAQNIVP